MARSGASTTNQWGAKSTGSRALEGVLIDDPNFSGRVTIADVVPTPASVLIAHPDFIDSLTFADSGTPAGYLVDDPDFAGSVTPDGAATEADTILYDDGDLGGASGFATPNTQEFSVVAYLIDDVNFAGRVTPDTSGTAETADAIVLIPGGSTAIIVGV